MQESAAHPRGVVKMNDNRFIQMKHERTVTDFS